MPRRAAAPAAASSSATVETLLALMTEMAELQKKITATLAALNLGSKAKGKAAAAAKPKKEKAACPAAADGVIRFGTSSGTNPYRVFSNLYRAEITLDGKVYPSVEHYVQSMKFVGSDDEYAERIRLQKNAAMVVGMSRSKEHPVRADWEHVKMEYVRKGLAAKFAAHPELKKLLEKSTGEIEYESTVDSYWGIGADGKGENQLGVLLMELRGDEFESEAEAESDEE